MRTPLSRPPLLKAFSSLALLAGLLALQGCGNDSVTVTTADTQCAQLTDGGSVDVGSGLPGDPTAPEPASGYRPKALVSAKTYMVVSANPYASKAGCEILKKGGSAVDAAVAVQAVLGLVEPQSSGLGGGAFMLHYDAKTKKVQSYDGRETAPAAATEDYLRTISATNSAPPLPIPAGTAPESSGAFNALRQSGRSVGTPGAVRMLELAHKDYGSLAWKDLFQSGVQLASDGFPISGRMAAAIDGSRTLLLTDPEAAAYFLNADGTAKPLGTVIKNPAYAATLTALASTGANALYTGPIAENIVKKIKMTSGGSPSFAITPGLTELSDLANYQAKKRDPVCTTYRSYWVCGMGAPSSGGMTVASALGTLENFYLAGYKPTAMDTNGGKPTVMGVHLISEAERLAYADRNKYMADTDFVPLPGGTTAALLDKAYLRNRANLIDFSRSMGTAVAGTFTSAPLGISSAEGKGTTHMTIVDKQGNVVVMTTTIESGMGSFRMTNGFLLNNQLTDFSVLASDSSGPIANRIQANKRPRSSMAPTLVFKMADDGSMGDFLMGTGSPGGATIIQYVVKTLVGVLDWGMDAQQATSMVDFGAANSATTNVGGEHPNINATTPSGGLAGGNDPLVTGLRAMGHTVSVSSQSSGISTIVKTTRSGATVLEGGADPRRENLALGDTFKP
ncbi:MAG: gamma-glutamyltransferase family protein [Burkholderiaceae bacterium]